MIRPFRINLSKIVNFVINIYTSNPPTLELNQHHARSDNTAASTAAIAAAITDSISMSHLPVPEPIIFKGEPIEYSDWKFSFYALVDRKCISASDKMYY